MTTTNAAIPAQSTPSPEIPNEIERLLAAARDALTDDIVSRVGATAAEGFSLLDRVNRSGIDRALPIITQLVESGDLERVAGLTRLVASAEDALSDDIVSRFALLAGELMCLVDRTARNQNLLRLLDLLGQDRVQAAISGALNALVEALEEQTEASPAHGGFKGLFTIARDPGTQDALRLIGKVASRLRND